ncbi:MAG: hypothetical protein ACFFA0_13910 [Promethearchaeota archaeon]
MEQIIVKEDSPVELEELHIVLLKKSSKSIQKDTEEFKKRYDLFELYKNLKS